MRYKRPTRRYGDEEIVSTFLWLKLTIGNETRWLERASFKRRFMGYNVCPVGGYREEKWDNIEWVTTNNKRK